LFDLLYANPSEHIADSQLASALRLGRSVGCCRPWRAAAGDASEKPLVSVHRANRKEENNSQCKFPVAICKLHLDKHGMEITPEKLQILRGYKLQFQTRYFPTI